MKRFLLAAVVGLAAAAAARAHFVYLLVHPDGSKVQVVLSDELAVDDAIDSAKFAATKLYFRGADGKDVAVPVTTDKHHLDAKVPGPGLLYGTTDYGVLQKGDAKPFALKYHSKAVVGPAGASTVGDAVPIEIVPVVEASQVKFRVLAKKAGVADVEVSVILPGDKKEKVKTDKDGYTKAFAGAGRYGAWARHVETSAGEAGGKKFDEVRHYATVVVDVK
ncbi:MAG TPA: DUF4198 domain-containing protein [Gemmataceae bacterium]|nr:DUF4198 domain-containing protein [Gemmataceae bacterium]